MGKSKQKKDKKNWMQKLVDIVENFFLSLFRKIGLKKFSDWYLKHQEGMRYLVFGALATIVNILTYDICFYLINIPNDISNIIAWIIAAIFAYFTNKLCVFNSKANTKKALLIEAISFFSFRLLSFAFDQSIMIFTVDHLGLHAGLMKVIANIIVIILNFIFSKLFIFKKKTK